MAFFLLGLLVRAAPGNITPVFGGFFLRCMEKAVKHEQVATVPEKPVNVKGVCEYLGCKETFLYEQCNRKVFPFHQVGGRKYFFLSEIETALKML